jgi:hypothetical protein
LGYRRVSYPIVATSALIRTICAPNWHTIGSTKAVYLDTDGDRKWRSE